MIISLKWISDFVDVSEYFAKPKELADALTAAGLEVEAVEDPSLQFKHVVVGQIVEKGQHPDADRLTLCQVDVGEGGGGKLKQIVCGAKNHQKGDKVVVALPGAILPGNFEIKLSKIRGVESSGMLASESELGLKKESEGILILPSDAKIGQPFAEYFGLDDVIFEINVTPNRADCLSHFGLAREIAALLDRPLKPATVDLNLKADLSVRSAIGLKINQPKLCPRYSARLITHVKVGPSPDWLKNRLESVGMNSINNVVDITNFVMMEMGQPLHAFDADQLGGEQVIVDVAHADEKFVTLDGSELTLSGEELTIRDQSRAVCLAGVVGGQNSGVSDSTSRIFLESAHFAMESVRKTSRKFGLQTDSAYRFSRGTDVNMVLEALNRASYLLQTVCGGHVSGDFYDIYDTPKEKPEINVRFQYVSDRLGYDVSSSDFVSWMKRLGCEVLDSDDTQVVLQIPTHRGDLEQEVDLVEEYGRLNGYDKIPEVLPSFSTEPLPHDTDALVEDAVITSMMALGYSQAINYGFTSSKLQADLFGDLEAFKKARLNYQDKRVKLKNPLSEELNEMRSSLIPGLLGNLFYNFRYGNHTGRLFEIGARYFKNEASFGEDQMLSLVAWGQVQTLWNQKPAMPLFFEVKASLEALFDSLSSFELRAWEGGAPGFLHPGQAAVIFCQGINIGFIGTLHPHLLEREKIRVPVVVAEFTVAPFKRGFSKPLRVKTPAKYQSVERDLTFLVDEHMASSLLIQVIKKAAGSLLQSVVVTDEFRGGDLPSDKKSLSFRMVLQDESGTLKDDQLAAVQSQIIEQAQKKLSVKLR